MRRDVFVRLRQWGGPIAPTTLARWMNLPPRYVHSSLQALYARDLIDRAPQPKHPHRFCYSPKALAS